MTAITHLKAGDKVPAFKAPDQHGKLLRAADLKGQRYVLFFYPNDSTATCTKEACNLRDNYKALQKAGYRVIGISHAPPESKKKFAEKNKLPYTLLADTNLKIANAFGVYGEKLFMGRMIMTIHRITFIIDAAGVIERIIYPVRSGEAAQQILSE